MEGKDLMAKFDDLVRRFKAEFEETIESERAKMKEEVASYQAEKTRMKAVTVSDNDIIHLNVGGQKMTTTRSTLCQVKESLFASMFSGRWEDGLERDKDGCIFFDFNPQYFGLILDYLRAKKIETPENPAPLPKVSPEHLKNFNNLAEYLGLKDEVNPKIIKTQESFNLHSASVTLEECQTVAVHGSNSRHEYVLGQNTYQEGVVCWQLKLESFQNNNWMFVGVVNANTVPSGTLSCGWSGSYGWALGNSGQVYTHGAYTNNDSLKNVCKQGETVRLTLDCTAAKLTLVLPATQQFVHALPGSTKWRLHINLHGANDKIRIL